MLPLESGMIMASLDVLPRPPNPSVHRPARPAGVGLGLDAPAVLACAAAATRFADGVTALLAAGERVCVTITGLGRGVEAALLFGECLALLEQSRARAHVPGRELELALPADALAPGDAWALRRQQLGPGALYCVADAAGLPGGRFLHEVWRLRGTGFVTCVYRQTLRATSPLLAGERAELVQPPLGRTVPAGSAWAWRNLNVAVYGDSLGKPDLDALGAALEAAVDDGDRLHEEHAWPLPAMRDDAWRNRRLAIHLTGFGDLLARRAVLPPGPRLREELGALLAFAKRVLVERSRSLAGRRGLLPALEQNDPTRSLDGQARAAWGDRWRRALETAAVRHRNLLTLSPFSFLPTSPAHDSRYLELLSLLDHADACAFAPPFALRHFGFNEFKHLQETTRVALARRDAPGLIAEQV